MITAPSRAIAGCVALAAFSISIVAGLAAQNPAATILIRACLALAICYPIGLIVGRIAQWVVTAHGNALATAAATQSGDSVDSRETEAPGGETPKEPEALAA